MKSTNLLRLQSPVFSAESARPFSYSYWPIQRLLSLVQ
jgi:hypothetical protein